MRRRNSAASSAKRIGDEPGKVSHVQINYSGPSFSDLPKDILLNILLRLSIKRIFICKRVCKTWNDLISEPEFAKLHFEQGQIYPMIRTSNASRILHLVQPEKDDFELKLDMCDHDCFKSECAYHVDAELHTKFELPSSNLHMTDGGKDSSHNILDHDCGAQRNKSIKMDIEDPNYRIANSCNGLLCLSGPCATHPLIVCNPITGEFTKLPEAKSVEDLCLEHGHHFIHGFGFSPSTNQYKVIRMAESCMRRGPLIGVGTVAAVHILGTELWKDLGSSFMSNTITEVPPIYLNGFLYWFSHLRPVAILSFDIEKERIEPVLKPPVKNTIHDYNVGMGVLRGELCTTNIEDSWPNAISFWVLKDSSDKQEWSKLFSIEVHLNQVLFDGPFQPIKYLNDGAVLMLQPSRNRLLYMVPGKRGFKSLMVRGMQSRWMEPKMEGIGHIPSFVSLKHALSLSGQNIKVLHVKPRIMVMLDYGAKQEWSKVFSIELYSRRIGYGPFQPIKYLNDGSLLMFQPLGRGLAYKDPIKLVYRLLAICGLESPFSSKMEVIAHIPSYVSLKYSLALSVQNVKVLNVNSRYASLELYDEGKAISFDLEVQEEPESEWDMQESDSEDGDLEFDSENRVLESNSKDRKMIMLGMKLTTMGLLGGGALLGLCLWLLRRKSSRM